MEGNDALDFNLMEDIRKIGDVVKNEKGIVPFDQFIQMFIVIRHHGKIKLEVEAVHMKEKRREALRESPNQELNDEYRDIVNSQTSMEE